MSCGGHIMMPEIDGFAFARSVREVDENMPIIFLTAREDFESKKRGFEQGNDDYLTKPVRLEELVLRVGALLRRAGIVKSKKLEFGNVRMDLEEHSMDYMRKHRTFFRG